MNYANETSDILDNLLTDAPDEAFPELEALSEFIHRNQGSATAKQKKAAGKGFPDAMNPPKRKVTYYLSRKVLVELSEAKAKIKVLVPAELKRKVSMSRIVDYAVKAILEEFNTVGGDSELVQQILKDG